MPNGERKFAPSKRGLETPGRRGRRRGPASGQVMLAAAFLGTPLAVFEPNAYPGLVNRWMAPYVARSFVAFDEAARYFGAGKAVLTGIPVRHEVFKVPAAG